MVTVLPVEVHAVVAGWVAGRDVAVVGAFEAAVVRVPAGDDVVLAATGAAVAVAERRWAGPAAEGVAVAVAVGAGVCEGEADSCGVAESWTSTFAGPLLHADTASIRHSAAAVFPVAVMHLFTMRTPDRFSVVRP